MEKSTVIEILKTFSKEELAKFGDFCSSPYHNKKSNVVKLYKAVRKFAPDFPAAKITKEEMWKCVFPGKKYNYGIMKNLIFDLNKLLLKFLELENHSSNFESDINILQQFKLRSLRELFIKRLKEARRRLSQSKSGYSVFYYSYMLEATEMTFIDYDYLLKTKGSDYYSELNKSLALFYFSSMFYHSTNNIQASFNINVGIDKDFLVRSLEYYKQSPFKNSITEILYHCNKALTELDNEENYRELKKLFYEYYKEYSKSIQYDFAACLLNFCSNNHARGNRNYVRDEFTWIKLIIEEKLYRHTSYGWMDQYLFMKSVMNACRVGEFQWAENFIVEHKDELIDSIRSQYENYAYVTLNLRRGKFEEALTYLGKCSNVDGRDKLNIKVFEFNAYYELGYYDELKALADTTNHFLKKDKIFSTEEHSAYKNYVIAISKLMDYKFNIGNKQTDKAFLPGVIKLITENKILNRSWLLKKIEELKAIKN